MAFLAKALEARAIDAAFSDRFEIAVDSTNVVSASWDGVDMVVKFKGGRAYSYFGVTRQDFEGLLSTDSPGRYVNNYLAPRYQASRVS
jgi:hypothetical protein